MTREAYITTVSRSLLDGGGESDDGGKGEEEEDEKGGREWGMHCG